MRHLNIKLAKPTKKISKRFTALCLIIMTHMLCVPIASATPVLTTSDFLVFSDRNHWLQALNGSTIYLEDLSDEPTTTSPTNSLTLLGSNITASVTKGNSTSTYHLGVLNEAMTLQVDPNDLNLRPAELTFNLNSAYEGVAFSFSDVNRSSAATTVHMRVHDLEFTLYDLMELSTGFVGIISLGAAIDEFSLTNGTRTGGVDFFNIDNIELAQATAVSAANSFFIVFMGFIGLLATRFRRNNACAQGVSIH